MRIPLISINTGLFCTLLLQSGLCPATSGDETAANLQARYLAMPTHCGSSNKPRFLCAGIILKGTTSSTEAKSWNPTTEEQSVGGMSFSYLARDAVFDRLKGNASNGFIVYPGDQRPEGIQALQIQCFFPTEGDSAHREDQGCGRSALDDERSRACHEQGIQTAEAWRANYRGHPARQCGFATKAGLGDTAVKGFNEGIRAIGMLPDIPFRTNNELVGETWQRDIPQRLPIEAFFYLPDRPLALQKAQQDQRQFYQETGTFVPVITLSLPNAGQQTPARLDYQSSVQAQLGDVICERYFISGRWFERSDVNPPDKEWALGLVPSDCARAIKANPSPAAEAAADREMRAKFSQDWQWVQFDKGGMTQQMICHARIAHDKPEWNLEPFRPNRPLEDYLAAGCNLMP